MFLRVRHLIAVLAAVCPAAAQDFTSPRGLVSTEGDASHFALFHSGYERFMQVDDTQTGHPAAAIRGIAFRRDGDRADPQASARTVDLTVRMGLADYANASGTFATNWNATPTTVFTRKTIRVPDWSQLASTRPAPFDLVLPFDATFTYDGSMAMAFELVMENTTGASSPYVDAERGATLPYRQAVGQTFDFGCLVTGQRIEMAHSLNIENYGPGHALYGIRLGFAVVHAPLSQAAVVNVDITDPNLAVAGLCTKVHALPKISLALGSTSTTGAIPTTWFDVPYSPAFEGLHLFTQALALDPQAPGLPIALSDRRDAVVPDAPRTAPHCAYLYAPSVNDPSATLWRDRGVVVRFQR